jgi:hypothetical protein
MDYCALQEDGTSVSLDGEYKSATRGGRTTGVNLSDGRRFIIRFK